MVMRITGGRVRGWLAAGEGAARHAAQEMRRYETSAAARIRFSGLFHGGSGVVSAGFEKRFPTPCGKRVIGPRDDDFQAQFCVRRKNDSRPSMTEDSMHRRMALLGIVIALASAAGAFAQAAPVFTTEDMLAVRTFAGGQPVAVSADGRRVAYVLTDMNDEWNVQEPRPTGHVVVQTLTGDRPGAPRPLTSGAAHSAFPVWSPDGHRLAFVREEPSGGRVTIWDADRDVMTPVGEPFSARAYLAPQWDPSGRSLIVAVPIPDRPTPTYRV